MINVQSLLLTVLIERVICKIIEAFHVFQRLRHNERLVFCPLTDKIYWKTGEELRWKMGAACISFTWSFFTPWHPLLVLVSKPYGVSKVLTSLYNINLHVRYI